MSGRNTIIINGKVYDALSGLPVAAPDPIAAKPRRPAVANSSQAFSDIGPAVAVQTSHDSRQHHSPKAANVHQTIKKSKTLRRDAVKAPVAQSSLRRKPQLGHVAKSPAITKFAAHPQPLESATSSHTAKHTEAPVLSHAVTRAHQKVSKGDVAVPERMSSRALKEKLISERLATVETPSSSRGEQHSRKKFFATKPRLASMITACFALVVLGGYLTYLNMPNLSVRVAAAQAGIAATFPDYRPDGYRFDGPVSFVPGEVSIAFKANGGNRGYTVTEKSSPWDSQAVYDNVVAKQSNGGYITNSQQGLTVYTYGNKAAWVNGGILYTIDGDAPLSNEQLLAIAGSL